MISSKKVVVDANILLRAVFGRNVSDILSMYEDVEFYAPESCLLEALRNIPMIAERKQVDTASATRLLEQLFIGEMVVPVDHGLYGALRARALARTSKHDLNDWPVIAVALLIHALIWTEDRDFFGCGIANWTTDRIELYLRDA